MSEELKIGNWYLTYEPRTEEAGEIMLSGEEQVLAYGDFVMKEDWEAFKLAIRWGENA